MRAKVVQGFVWFLVTDVAKEIYLNGLFELYILHDDDSESLVEGFTQLSEALENGEDIGIEVGHLTIKQNKDEFTY
jgi:hypothetical protein